MSALRFTLRAAPKQRLDLAVLTPARLAGLDRAAIEKLALNTTRAPATVGDVFHLRMGDPTRIEIEGGSDRLDNVGAGMTSGTLLLDGNAGIRAGRGMQGGALEIRGSVGPFAASGLRGGRIEIGADAGDFLGSPMPGERAGMAGGTVIVRGRAGARAGDRLRRGLVVVEGDAGDAPGSRMIAGTLIVCGRTGALPGYLMRRGTMVLGRPATLLPTFVETGLPSPVFLRLLATVLEAESRRAARLLASISLRLAGDMATLGKGELLAPAG